MARINRFHFAGWAVLLFISLCFGGCTASMQARTAFEEAELLNAEENYDKAVEKYFAAAELEPTSKKYKLELISSRTRASASHVKIARILTTQGKYQDALAEYRLARGFDPSIEVATQEAEGLKKLLEARQFTEEGAIFYQKREVSLARKAIDKALKLDANNARALALKELLDKELHTVAMDGIELDIVSEEPITLRFKDTNIKEVFGIISKLSGINFIFDEEIRDQSITVFLEKANFAQAMELIMQMNGLGKKVLNSRTIILYPETREKEKQYDDQLIQTFYLSHIDAKKAVNLLRTMLQLRKVYVHEERNALVVRDTPDVIRLAEKILEAADRENSEVIFDLELVSVSSGDKLDFGPQLSTYSAGAGLSKDGENIVNDVLGNATAGLVESLNNLQTYYTLPSVAFDFAKTLSDSEILASPKIRVRNREKAKVHIGTREPVITVTQNGDNYSDNVQYVDVGVKLDVEPNIQLDNTVETKLKLEVSQKIDEATTDRGTKYLTISTTNAETVLTLKDGVPTIIGGLFEQQDTSSRKTIPFLGDIPLLGNLFTSYENSDLKREILLSITPYIIKQVEVPDIDVATIWSGGEDNLKNGPNFGAFAEPLRSEVEASKPLSAPAVKQVAIIPPETAETPIVAPITTPVTLPPSNSESPFEPPSQELGAIPPPAEAKSEAKNPFARAEKVVSPEPAPGELTVSKDVLASSAMRPVEAFPPVIKALSEEAAVATEELFPREEVGAPVVLAMPEKAAAALVFAGPQTVALNEEFTLVVEIKDVEGLYSAPLFINYDPALLELISINEGSFLKQGGQVTVFSSSPNRATGQVIVGYKQGAGGSGASGSGNLFNLNFKPKAAGKTEVEINRVNFRNPEGIRLQVTPGAATIEIR